MTAILLAALAGGASAADGDSVAAMGQEALARAVSAHGQALLLYRCERVQERLVLGGVTHVIALVLPAHRPLAIHDKERPPGHRSLRAEDIVLLDDRELRIG